MSEPDERLEAEYREDRRSLLEHYSGKATAQATCLLSEALIAVSIGALIEHSRAQGMIVTF